MYALAVNGSPRKGGNTEILLREVLGELDNLDWQTELVQVGGTAVRGCLACHGCFRTQDNRCAQEEDAFNGIYSRMLRADAIILGSPVYFAAVGADLKALIERAGYVAYANNHAFAGKIGAAVVAVRRGGATHVFDTINHMFQMSQMVVPGSTYWNMGFGLHKEDVQDDTEGMANMRHLGRAISWLGKAMQPVQASYPKKGRPEE